VAQNAAGGAFLEAGPACQLSRLAQAAVETAPLNAAASPTRSGHGSFPKLAPGQREVPAPFEKAMHYLETQVVQIGNCQVWQEQGYPIGSGLPERAVAVVALRVQRINAYREAAVA
jgi:hypothetical protein